MPLHIALLRGINVGANPLKMERLRAICADLGFKNIQTYVQSGNVIFEFSGPAERLSHSIEQSLKGETRLPVPVIVRSATQWTTLIAANPFLKQKRVDPKHLHVTFLSSIPAKDGLEKLRSIEAGQDCFEIVDSHVYLHCPGGYGQTKLSNGRIEKALGIRATTRNWRTVNKLGEMAQG